MKKGGTGGGHTVTGLHFENRINLLTKLSELPNYEIKGSDIFYAGKHIEHLTRNTICTKSSLSQMVLIIKMLYQKSICRMKLYMCPLAELYMSLR